MQNCSLGYFSDIYLGSSCGYYFFGLTINVWGPRLKKRNHYMKKNMSELKYYVAFYEIAGGTA